MLFRSVLVLAFALAVASVFGQKNLPSVDVKKLDGQTVNIADFGKLGKPVVISFWATWCSPCKKELDAINEEYKEWHEKYGVEIVAISVDDARSAAKVKATVEQKGWPFTILLDSNQDFQHAMNIESVPHSFLLNAKGEIVWEHNGYTPGDEAELEEKIAELKK